VVFWLACCALPSSWYKSNTPLGMAASPLSEQQEAHAATWQLDSALSDPPKVTACHL